jgi:CubicO group peptidase (beta-lactamase class C family)
LALVHHLVRNMIRPGAVLAGALLAATLAAAPAAAQLTKEAQAVNAFADKLDQAAAAPDFVGLAVAVVRDNRVVLMRTYGVREAGRPEKVTPDTVFRIASLSKGFAGAITALEAKDGDLKLSDPISRTGRRHSRGCADPPYRPAALRL